MQGDPEVPVPQYAPLPDSTATRLVEVLPTFERARLILLDRRELVRTHTSGAPASTHINARLAVPESATHRALLGGN
jgi:hypothetical protein